MLTNAEVVEALEMIYRDVAGDARESAIVKIRSLQAWVREVSDIQEVEK